jgi:hypothetical protein
LGNCLHVLNVFASLPQQAVPWSSNIYTANSLLCEHYRRSAALLASDSYNLHQVKLHQESILKEAIPLLLEIEDAASDEELPLDWVHEVSDHFASLLVELEDIKETIQDR